MAYIPLHGEYRELLTAERKVLTKVCRSMEQEIYSKLNWKLIIIYILLTILCALHIYYYDKSNWSLPSKFLVCIFPILIWVTIEIKYKGRKKKIDKFQSLNHILNKNEIRIFKINAKQIVKFIEYEDEGTLYLVETVQGERFYLWDDQYMIPKSTNFPNNYFEIYADELIKNSLGRKVVGIGDKLDSLIVKTKDKWTYYGIHGFPDDLEIENKKIDELLEQIKKAHNTA